MNLAESSGAQSIKLIRLVGYVLFVLSIFDTIALFFPPAFMNPVWELQLMGRFVDAVPVPLIALVMIFFAESSDRLRIEKRALRFLSWLCLVLAIIHFAILPLGLGNTWRVNNRNNNQIGATLTQQITPLQTAETRLKQAGSEIELQKIITGLVQANPNQPPTITDPKAIRERMLSGITIATQKFKADSDAARSATSQNLIKLSAKLNLGTLAAAIAYFFLWKLTPWARTGGKRRNRSKQDPQESEPANT